MVADLSPSGSQRRPLFPLGVAPSTRVIPHHRLVGPRWRGVSLPTAGLMQDRQQISIEQAAVSFVGYMTQYFSPSGKIVADNMSEGGKNKKKRLSMGEVDEEEGSEDNRGNDKKKRKTSGSGACCFPGPLFFPPLPERLLLLRLRLRLRLRLLRIDFFFFVFVFVFVFVF